MRPGTTGGMASPGVSGRRGKTRYNYVRNVVRSAKKFEASRDERMSLMDEQHRFIVEDLEGQLIQLSKENAELREKLKLQPENFFQAITEVRNGRGVQLVKRTRFLWCSLRCTLMPCEGRGDAVKVLGVLGVVCANGRVGVDAS